VPAEPKPKKKKKKPVVVAPVPSVPEAESNTPPPVPPASVVGALTAGGDAEPAEQQKASESISEVEKRLAGLSAATLETQKDGVARVRNFLRQANDALKNGDADGALTLATKAKLLLDDLLK
jgi:molybdopterin converting factor small subunit